MLGQDFLLSAIEAETGEGKQLDFVKQVLSTSLLKVKDYTCIIIEEDDYDYGQLSGGSQILQSIEPYFLSVVIKSSNTNALTDETRRELKSTLDEQTEKVLLVIIDAKEDANGIADVSFGKAKPYDIKIGASPAMEIIIPVTVTVMK